MAAKKRFIVFLSVLLTALVVGAGGYLLWGKQLSGLERYIAELERANTALQKQVAALQDQLGDQPDQNKDNETAINRAPHPGWEAYFPEPDTTTLKGAAIREVRNLLGEPPILLRSIAADPANNREIWIFFPHEEDPTGLYIYFKGNRVYASRLDEFAGLFGSGLLDDDFWTR